MAMTSPDHLSHSRHHHGVVIQKRLEHHGDTWQFSADARSIAMQEGSKMTLANICITMHVETAIHKGTPVHFSWYYPDIHQTLLHTLFFLLNTLPHYFAKDLLALLHLKKLNIIWISLHFFCHHFSMSFLYPFSLIKWI